MRKLIVTTLSALGVGLLIATPDQAKADFTWNCTSTSSGVQSGSFTGDITIETYINGVQQPPTTQKIEESYTNVLQPTTSNCVNSNPGNSLLQNLNVGNGFNSNPGNGLLQNLNIGNGFNSNPGNSLLQNLNIGNGINLNPVIFQNQKRR